MLVLGPLEALAQILEGPGGAAGALGPEADIGGKGILPAAAQLGLVHERLQGGARLGGGGPALRHAGALFEQTAFEIRCWGEVLQGFLRILHALQRLRLALRETGQAFLQGRAALAELGFLALGNHEPGPGGIERLPGLAGGLDRLHLVRGCLADGFERGLRLVAQVLRLLAGFRRLTLQVAEAILFDEATGSGRGRFGGGGEAVPAPQVAFRGNQPLAGLQHAAQAQAVGLAHHADLAQAALERGGRLGEVGERTDAVRQGRIAFAGRWFPPNGAEPKG